MAAADDGAPSDGGGVAAARPDPSALLAELMASRDGAGPGDGGSSDGSAEGGAAGRPVARFRKARPSSRDSLRGGEGCPGGGGGEAAGVLPLDLGFMPEDTRLGDLATDDGLELNDG